MAEQTDIPDSRQAVTAEDAGRIDPSRTGRLIAILVALVLYSEVAPMQLGAVSIIVPKIATSFPGAGAGVTWGVTIVGVVGGATMACVPESPLRVRQRFDVIGAALFGAGIGLSLVYVSQGSSWGWANIGSLGYLIAGLIALAAFIAWEQRTPEPMMELSLLRSPKVSILMAVAFLVTLAITAISIIVAYMFQTPVGSQLKNQILAGAAAQNHVPVSTVAKFVTFRGDLSYANGFSVLSMALHITAWTALFGMLFGVLGGYVCRRVGARLPLIISGASLLVATALWVAWHTSWQEQLFIGLLYGVAFGFYYAANPNLLMDAVPASRQGVSAGMLAVFGSIGTSVGTAVFTAIVAAHPFQTAGFNPLTRKTIVTSIPQVYTNTGYTLAYVAVGVIPAALTLALALALRTGRAPARGGAAEVPAAEVPAAGTLAAEVSGELRADVTRGRRWTG